MNARRDGEPNYGAISFRLKANLALLQRYAEAEQLGERAGTSLELDHDAWYAIEEMMRDA